MSATVNVLTGLFSTVGLSLAAATVSEKFKRGVVLPVVDKIGDVFGVNRTADETYKNFYLAGLEVAKIGVNVDPFEAKYLDKNKKYFLMTAVRDDGEYAVARKFLLTEELVKSQLRLDDTAIERLNMISIGNPNLQSNIPTPLDPRTKMTISAKGQYLRCGLSALDFKIYPRLERINTYAGDTSETAHIDRCVREGRVKSGFVCWKNFDPS